MEKWLFRNPARGIFGINRAKKTSKGAVSIERNNRTGLVVAIAVVVIAAVFASFGIPALTSDSPKTFLSDLSQKDEEQHKKGFLPITVTPQTVQEVIKTIERPSRYARELMVTLHWTAGEQSYQQEKPVRVWKDQDRIKTEIQTETTVEHRLISGGTLYIWYEDDTQWQEKRVDSGAEDLIQRIPTYEWVLQAKPEQISQASYEKKGEKDCIYVEIRNETLHSIDRYWVEIATGLLYAAETESDGMIVYTMQETAVQPLEQEEEVFSLPDGSHPS